MTTKELISILSKYPADTVLNNINQVVENAPNNVSLYYKESLQEVEDRKRRIEEANRKHQEEFDRRGEITSFANRW